MKTRDAPIGGAKVGLTSDVRAHDKPAASAQKSPAGFPASDEVQGLFDEADLNRAVETYRFFYPTVSGAANFKVDAEVGIVDNKVLALLDSKPRHAGFTYNSDTPSLPPLHPAG